MSSLAQAKALGGIGSILIVLTALPSVGWLVGLIGFILVLVAVKYISDEVRDPSVFNNMLISVLAGIAGIVVGAAFVLAELFTITSIMSGVGGPGGFEPSSLLGIVGPVMLGLAMIWVAFIVSAVFLKKSYDNIALKLNVGLFRTTALLYLIGAATLIILVGFIVLLVAVILQIVAFFSIQEQPVQPTAPPQPSPV
jgi:uncharacterized membrane protein